MQSAQQIEKNKSKHSLLFILLCLSLCGNCQTFSINSIINFYSKDEKALDSLMKRNMFECIRIDTVQLFPICNKYAKSATDTNKDFDYYESIEKIRTDSNTLMFSYVTDNKGNFGKLLFQLKELGYWPVKKYNEKLPSFGITSTYYKSKYRRYKSYRVLVSKGHVLVDNYITDEYRLVILRNTPRN